MKKEVFLVIFFLLVSSVSAQLADSSWSMFHGSASHGGLSPYDTSHIDGSVKWTFETEDGIESSPVIDSNGIIYFGSHDGYLYAVNNDGTLKWKFKAGERFWDSNYGGQYKAIMATPAIAKDGTIYTYSSDHHLFAVNPDGSEKWKYYIQWMPDFWSSPTVGEDGTIYIGSARSNNDFKAGLYAINPDGTLKWIHEEGTGVTTPPSIAEDGTIYIGAATPNQDKSIKDTGKIIALSPKGEVKWEFEVKLWVEGASTVGSDGTIYTGTKEGDVYALTPQGKEIWRFQTKDGVSAAPAIGKDGTIYIGSWDAYFYALTSDGKLNWKYKTPDAFEGVSSSAAIGVDGTIYVGSNSGMFYAFNPNGTVKWDYQVEFSTIVAGPAIGKDGTIYFTSWDKKLYAIGSGDGTEIPSHKRELEGWNPKDEGVDCFQPDNPSIEEKCDIFCNDNLELCSDYFEHKSDKFDKEEFKEGFEKGIEEDLTFFQKIKNWFKELFI